MSHSTPLQRPTFLPIRKALHAFSGDPVGMNAIPLGDCIYSQRPLTMHSFSPAGVNACHELKTRCAPTIVILRPIVTETLTESIPVVLVGRAIFPLVGPATGASTFGATTALELPERFSSGRLTIPNRDPAISSTNPVAPARRHAGFFVPKTPAVYDRKLRIS